MKRSLVPSHDSSSRFAVYAFMAASAAIALYYLPDYHWLEKLTAIHSAYLLNMVGIHARPWTAMGSAFVNEFEIARDCTGVQVIAVFAGLLIPLRMVSWRKKLLVTCTIAAGVYLANVGRIAGEIWLLYKSILPWSLAHYPLGLALGVASVAFLVVVTSRFIPELGVLLSLNRDLTGAGCISHREEE